MGFFTEYREEEIQAIKGKEAFLFGSCAIKKNRGCLPCKWFSESTVIIGADPRTIVIKECKDCTTISPECQYYEHAVGLGMACFPKYKKNNFNNGARAEFSFLIPIKLIDKARYGKLRIESTRIDGRLHSKTKSGMAYIYLNGTEIDSIAVSDEYPQRKEFIPIDRNEPYKDREIAKGELKENLLATLKVNKDTYWDVDKVKLLLSIPKLRWSRIIGIFAIAITLIGTLIFLIS